MLFRSPIDEVKKIIPILEKSGSLKRGFIGIDLQDLDPQTLMYLGLDNDNRGSMVRATLANGPAEKAGLKMYDVIIEINDLKVRDSQDLANKIADLELGSKVKIKYLRNNKGQAVEKTSTLNIAERPTEQELLKRAMPRGRRK